MAKSSQDLSSKRDVHWTNKVSNEDKEAPTSFNSSSNTIKEETVDEKDRGPMADVVAQQPHPPSDARKKLQAEQPHPPSATRKKLQAVAVSRWRSVLTAFAKNRAHLRQGLGTRLVGTLFGYRHGHVHFAFQKEANFPPAFLIELATPISGLVKEMASGLVRIALECNKEEKEDRKTLRLLEEPRWRTFCNGKKCGFATRRECGAKEWKVLKALEPISMGAGVLPAGKEEGDGDDIMYMRAKFERVVGSRDSEAFYMMNPDSNGAPELSVYLLRV